MTTPDSPFARPDGPADTLQLPAAATPRTEVEAREAHPTALPRREYHYSPPPPPAPPAGAPSPVPAGRARLGAGQFVAVALVSALAGAAVAVPVARSTIPEIENVPVASAPAATGVDPVSTVTPGTVESVAASVSPSVVSIDVRSRVSSGSGSGVILTADGIVLTNAHVVDGATSVQVTLASGERYDAEVLGADARADIAVLRIDAADLPVPAFATSEPAVGSLAVAIGSPFGLDGSVTAGVVSALDRSINGGEGSALVGVIQTDAAINPGNSGGALVNGAGEVIGINTAIISGTGGNDGIGFAIPIATARTIADQLIENGVVRRAYLGISGQTVTDEVAQAYGFTGDSGVIVAEVVAGAPAAQAGLQPGDLIVAVDGQGITTMQDLLAQLNTRAPDDTVTLSVQRDGSVSQVTVTLGELTS